MRLMNICTIFGIRRLTWIAVNGRVRIFLSVPWPVEQDLSYTRTSTQRPRITDHGAGRVGSGIILSKRRQNNGRNKAQCRHLGCRMGIEWVSTGIDGYRIGVGLGVKMSQFMVKCDRSVQKKGKMSTLRHPFDTLPTP